jgi:hypothetical protein
MSELSAEIFARTAAHDEHPLTASEQARIQDTLALLPEDASSLLEVGAGACVLVNRAPYARARGL